MRPPALAGPNLAELQTVEGAAGIGYGDRERKKKRVHDSSSMSGNEPSINREVESPRWPIFAARNRARLLVSGPHRAPKTTRTRPPGIERSSRCSRLLPEPFSSSEAAVGTTPRTSRLAGDVAFPAGRGRLHAALGPSRYRGRRRNLRRVPGSEMSVQKALLGFLFWTAVALFFSTQGYLGRGGGWEALESALRRSLPQWYLWGFLSPFIFRADRWAKSRSRDLRGRVLRHVPLAFGFVSLYVVLRTQVNGLLAISPPSGISPASLPSTTGTSSSTPSSLASQSRTTSRAKRDNGSFEPTSSRLVSRRPVSRR